MSSKPVHAQTTSAVTDERRALVKRAADLCRADPATYAPLVRHADQLREAGVEHARALHLALSEVGTSAHNEDG